MEADREALVAGVFGSEKQAQKALERLHRLGVEDADVEIGAPEPGRYRIETPTSSGFWRTVRPSMFTGAVVGILIAMGIMDLAVPGLTPASLIELGLPMGAAWGIFFGGVVGMAISAMRPAEGASRYTVTRDSSDVLMVVHAGDRFGPIHDVMAHQHPRHLLADVPALDRS